MSPVSWRSLQERRFSDGELVFREGDPGREMFIVAEGRVRILTSVGGEQVTLGVVERGDFFGEMALLEGLPRMASACAVGDTRLQIVEPGGLLLRVRRDPTLAIEMLQRLSGRLRQSNHRLLDLLEESDQGLEAARTWEVGGTGSP